MENILTVHTSNVLTLNKLSGDTDNEFHSLVMLILLACILVLVLQSWTLATTFPVGVS